ncbi:MAG: zinc-ribbon domain-containing protein [Ruminococcaceae bacterium]|jgi:hypothetical protein|nr:zinc-ribbon domain-containing protein [Oscillospiraceae bacterium]
MFCLNCGNKLPDNAIICLKCGARITSADGTVRAQSQRPSSKVECSEKNQLMFRVQGRGLYFISEGKRLCVLTQANNSVRVLTEASPEVNLCGLGVSGGFLYFWQECQDEFSKGFGIHLIRMHPDTGEQEIVWECDEELFADYRLNNTQNRARAILCDGAYYLLNYTEQKLMRVTLPDGEWENLPLPDMKNKAPSYDWVEPRGVVSLASKEPNFGQLFSGLSLVNGQVFLSLDNSPLCTLRFPLGRPEEFVYLPKNTASAIQNGLFGGMLTCVDGCIFSCPGLAVGTNDLGLYEIKPDGNTVRMLSSEKDKIILQNKGGYWWRLGNRIYLGTIAVDPMEKKWHKLSPLLFDKHEFCNNALGEVLDFFPEPNGGVYLLTRTSLYLMTRDWELKVKTLDDLAQFRIVRLKDIK